MSIDNVVPHYFESKINVVPHYFETTPHVQRFYAHLVWTAGKLYDAITLETTLAGFNGVII